MDTYVCPWRADNFCWYSPKYDTLEGQKYDWAKDTLRLHASDKRDHVYTLEQLEQAKTHDKLWNAAQLEMVHGGKMHGFMRMYWAKKILEWTEGPDQALEFAIHLNDKYQLDGKGQKSIHSPQSCLKPAALTSSVSSLSPPMSLTVYTLTVYKTTRV